MTTDTNTPGGESVAEVVARGPTHQGGWTEAPSLPLLECSVTAAGMVPT